MEPDCTQLAAECAVLTAIAVVESAEAAVALAEASLKCQELEDCLNGEEPPAPASGALRQTTIKPCECKKRLKAIKSLQSAIEAFQTEVM